MKKSIIIKLFSILSAAALLIMCTTIASASGFTDTEGHWATESIDFVVREGLMNGVEDGSRFAPNMSLTRGMVVTVLYRDNGAPEVMYEGVFGDVADGAYYTSAAIWASENGVVMGTGEVNGVQMFSPDRNITRQELAVMFMRYARYLGANVDSSLDISSYPDCDKVASWATDSVRWAVEKGLITGKKSGGDRTLSPEDDASRAEFATIMERFKFNVVPVVLYGYLNEDVLEIRLVFNEPVQARALSVTPIINSERFSLVSGDWDLYWHDICALRDFSVEAGDGVIAFREMTEIVGGVMMFELKPCYQMKDTESFGISIVINDGTENRELKASCIVDTTK